MDRRALRRFPPQGAETLDFGGECDELHVVARGSHGCGGDGGNCERGNSGEGTKRGAAGLAVIALPLPDLRCSHGKCRAGSCRLHRPEREHQEPIQSRAVAHLFAEFELEDLELFPYLPRVAGRGKH